MDICRIGLHNPNMTIARTKIPSYRLFGEHQDDPADFWLHCEPIPERTHLHNWEIALHRHEQFFQLFLLPQGSGEIVSQDGILAFTAPVILFIPPDAGHGFRFTRDIDGLVVTALADRLRSLPRRIARSRASPKSCASSLSPVRTAPAPPPRSSGSTPNSPAGPSAARCCSNP